MEKLRNKKVGLVGSLLTAVSCASMQPTPTEDIQCSMSYVIALQVLYSMSMVESSNCTTILASLDETVVRHRGRLSQIGLNEGKFVAGYEMQDRTAVVIELIDVDDVRDETKHRIVITIDPPARNKAERGYFEGQIMAECVGGGQTV